MFKLYLIIFCLFSFSATNVKGQPIVVDGNAECVRFDGIGAVSGGGATTDLLKDYPEPQRSQILDLLFKPDFGASISALLIEIPGDGNSTQGSEPSHMHSKNDLNYSRGYEWWLIKEAKKRNPSITLDANVWSCPKWIGNGHFWSQDICDYDVKWIKGLKNVYGYNLDAIGCRNEKGENEDFVKILRQNLNRNNLSNVKIHAFDNWGNHKFNWCKDIPNDSLLRASVDIISAHTMSEIPTPAKIIELSEKYDKPIWNSEEHIYKKGFDCEISLVKSFNENFITSRATKIINWYLIGSTYPIEPFSYKPPMMIAREPWSGNYRIRDVLWGYAHYGQFTAAGWQYIKNACDTLPEGGSFVTLKSPKKDYSIIIETKDAKKNQKLTFNIKGGLSNGELCVWHSNAREQFIRLKDITPKNGKFEITVEPQSIYSISTMRGQRKGSYAQIPASKPFPLPYYETFDEYKNAKSWGYLPHYTADIDGIFEIAKRPDNKGNCLKQVIENGAQDWAPAWMPYTIIGDSIWRDYEVSANVYFGRNGNAGLMGRIISTGSGYGCKPSGYYMTLSDNGTCSLYLSKTKNKNSVEGKLLASKQLNNFKLQKWHTLKINFSGSYITCFVNGEKIITVKDSTFTHGMAGLISGSLKNVNNVAYFDDLLIKNLNRQTPKQFVFSKNLIPMYKK